MGMNRIVDTTEYLDMVVSLLREGKRDVPVPVKGVSMRPFLRDQDMAYLIPPEDSVRPGDILLFQRHGGQYILHRVQKCLPSGEYLMVGDNQWGMERIRPGQLRGKVSFVKIQGKVIAPGDLHWWFFAHPWRWLTPARAIAGRIRVKFRKN